MAKKSRFVAAKKEVARELYAQGYSYAEIADALMCSNSMAWIYVNQEYTQSDKYVPIRGRRNQNDK